MKNLLQFFVLYLPREFGRVELIANSYRKCSLKRGEQEGRGSLKIQIASLKPKVVDNFHLSIPRNTKNKKVYYSYFYCFSNQMHV